MISAEMCKKKTLSCHDPVTQDYKKIIWVFLTLCHLQHRDQDIKGLSGTKCRRSDDICIRKKKTNFIVITETRGAFYSNTTLCALQKLILGC